MGMEQARLAGRHGVKAVLHQAGTAGAPLAGAEQAQEEVGPCLIPTDLLVNLPHRIHARKVCLSADTSDQGVPRVITELMLVTSSRVIAAGFSKGWGCIHTLG